MAKMDISFKRVEISKAAKLIMGVVTAAAVALVVLLAGSRALLKQMQFQNRVITAKEKAKLQLEQNVAAVDKLKSAYSSFDSAQTSIIGTKDKNSKIILDALPSKYDFPALATSLEKILSAGGYTIDGIGGTDDEVGQTAATEAAGPVEIPFQLSVTTSYNGVQKLISDIDRSIRPIQIKSLELSGSDQFIKLQLTAKTYYQPEVSLESKTQEVK